MGSEMCIRDRLYTITSISGDTTNSYINFANVQALPGGNLSADAKIIVDERATIDFVDAYQKDLPGSTLNIKVEASDALAAKLQQIRTYDITPDSKSDSTLLIDVDDSSRLVVRPSDMSEKGLWPTTTNASYVGIVDSKYEPLPNAGYVSKYNVDYQAFDLGQFELLFDRDSRKASEIPGENDIVHFASSEHGEFDVYKLDKVAANVSYVEDDAETGTLKYFTDYQLSQNIIDNNDLSNVDAAYDHTAFFDNILVLKGNATLDAETSALTMADGEKYFDTTIPDTSSEVVVWSNENRLYEEAVTIGNVTYNHPKLIGIEKIKPVLSGNITNLAPDSYSNVSIPATAEMSPTTRAMDIYRNVEADMSTYNWNGVPAFRIRNGDVDGVRVGDYLKFSDTGSSNLNANVFLVASANPQFKEVVLYGNNTVLSGMSGTIAKSNLSFANYGKTSTANASGTYKVQVFSKKHGYDGTQDIKFSGHNLGKAQGTAFTLSNVSTNTFFVEGVASGNATLDVTDSSQTIGLKTDTVIVKFENGNNIATANLVQNAYVKITDTAGGNMNGNTFQITNVKVENVQGDLNSGVEFIEETVWSDTVTNSGTVTKLELGNGQTTDNLIGLGVQGTGIDPDLVKVTGVVYNKNKTVVGTTVLDTTSSATVELASTAGLEVGMVLDGTGISAIDGIRTIATIVDGDTITVDSAITSMPVGTVIEFTQFATNTNIKAVQLSSSVTVSTNDAIDFVSFTPEYENIQPTTKTVTSFEIPKGDITANSNTISFVVQDAINLTTDANVDGLTLLQDIHLYGMGRWEGIHQVRDVNSGSSTFKLPGTWTGLYTVTDTSASTLADSNELLLNTNNTSIYAGMLVSGGNISTKITEIDASANASAPIYKLASNIAINSGDTVTFTEDLYGNATFVSNQIEITTKANHNYVLDSADPQSTLIGNTVRIYGYDPEYYNYTFRISSVPVSYTHLTLPTKRIV